MLTILAGLTNWKTTSVGVAVAIANVYLSGGFAGLDTREALFSIASLVFGFLAKDADKSGIPRAAVLD